MLTITDQITIADWELTESFTRAQGPGGQNVNKVSTAVELRAEPPASPSDRIRQTPLGTHRGPEMDERRRCGDLCARYQKPSPQPRNRP